MAITTLLLLTGIANSADTRVPIVREAKTIMVEGVEEHWRLEWESVPKPHCGPVKTSSDERTNIKLGTYCK